MSSVLNPLASVLGLLQPLLRDLLCALRSLERTLVWTDRRLTLWLWLGLLALSALLALLALVVPWSLVWMLIGRLVGLLLLGPHMFFVGRWVDRRQAAAAAREVVYDEANDAGRGALLDEVRAEVEAEHVAAEAAEKAAMEKRPEWMKIKQTYLKGNKYNMLMQLPKVPTQKFVGVPDPRRSRAWPVPKGGDTALVAPAGTSGSATTQMNMPSLRKPSLPNKPDRSSVEKAQRSKMLL